MKRLMVLTSAVFAVFVLVGSDLSAAKPRRVTSKGVLTVSPSPVVPFGSVYSVTGSGFKAGAWVVVNLEATCELGGVLREAAWYGTADSTGSLAFVRTTSNCRGPYSIYGIEGRNTTASTNFTVQ